MIITVVGLGVIGGSYIKALHGLGHQVYGVDLDQKTLDQAKNDGYIIDGFQDASKICYKSDLTMICLYPSLILEFIKNTTFKPGSIVSDAVGVKSHFIEEARKNLPNDVELLSGHPMAGREKKGYSYASKEVFKNANYIIVQDHQNKVESIALLEKLIQDMGFKSIKILNPVEHDEIISFTSQLPHALAVALINSDDQKYDTGRFIGDSYRDLTRIANINEDLWSELFLNNKDNLLVAMNQFEQQFDALKLAIQNNDEEALKQYFIQSTKRREQLEHK